MFGGNFIALGGGVFFTHTHTQDMMMKVVVFLVIASSSKLGERERGERATNECHVQITGRLGKRSD
jgi:hypothetical protein